MKCDILGAVDEEREQSGLVGGAITGGGVDLAKTLGGRLSAERTAWATVLGKKVDRGLALSHCGPGQERTRDGHIGWESRRREGVRASTSARGADRGRPFGTRM